MRWLTSHIQSPAHRGAMPLVTKDITVTEAQVLIVERQHELPCEHWCFSKLADLMLTFSSFCFMYLMYSILFILLPYGTAIISFAFLLHIRLSRPQCVYQEFFFSTLDAHAAVMLLSAGWKEKSSSQRRQIMSSFAYFPFTSSGGWKHSRQEES